jgi:ribose transport system permease protein
MNKKDLFLLILILTVGAIVAILNPRFLLPFGDRAGGGSLR